MFFFFGGYRHERNPSIWLSRGRYTIAIKEINNSRVDADERRGYVISPFFVLVESDSCLRCLFLTRIFTRNLHAVAANWTDDDYY